LPVACVAVLQLLIVVRLFCLKDEQRFQIILRFKSTDYFPAGAEERLACQNEVETRSKI
jgi:hypothetical protein